MSDATRPYVPLKPDNTAILLIDHQLGLFTGVRDFETGELKHNVVAFAKAAKAMNIPIILATIGRDTMWGPTFPELTDALPGVAVHDRSVLNVFDDPEIAAKIEATGRQNLIFAGISLEVCAGFPSMTAVRKGYNSYVAVDASGTFSQTKRETGLLRMVQAGVVVSDYATLIVELLGDNASPLAGEVYAALDMPWATLVGQLTQSARGK